MTHFYTADLHLGHASIIAMCNRPFTSVEEMDQVLVENIRKRVCQKDDLWIVGDLAMAKMADRPRIEALFKRIPGRKHLIIGNHDKRWVHELKWHSIGGLKEIKDEGRRVTLCHYPLMTWPGSRHGAMQLFGHVHNNWVGCRGSVNVGVDLWDFMPVTLDEAQTRSQTLPRNLYWEELDAPDCNTLRNF